jgi:nitroreductase
MEFKQVIGTRRTTRFFEPNKPVERSKIQTILEAANRCSRSVNADYAKAVVCYRDELDPEVLQALKTPTTTVQFDLAPVAIFWFGDSEFHLGAHGRLKQLFDLGALAPTHGWSHDYVDTVAYPQVVEGIAKDPVLGPWMTNVETGLAICQAMLAAVDEGLGVGLSAYNFALGKEILKVPDTWIPNWVMLVGYSAEGDAGGQRPRNPLSENYFEGHVGNPFHEDPEVTEQLRQAGMIQESMEGREAQRRQQIRELADRFGLPL